MGATSARRRVLVTDDDPLVRWALRACLEALDLDVIEASTVRETLERESAADVVLLDVRLPDGDGLQAARDLLGRQPERPVLLMTAFSTPELEAEAVRIGVRRCLGKPFDIERVARVVGETFVG